VVVVGAGIVGCATAYELARRSVSVCLVDRGDVSSGTTGLGEGNVLCSDKRPGPELELARRGLALYDEIEELLGEEGGIRRKGALVVHSDPGSWAAEPERVAALRSAGVECSLLSAGEVREAEAALRGPLLGASWFPDDLQCNPRAIARGLAREAARLGAVVETGREVRAIVPHGGHEGGVRYVAADISPQLDGPPLRAGRIVLAAGVWSAPLVASVGLHLPLEPRKGQLVRLERRPDFLRHKVIDGGYMAAVESEDARLKISTVMETTLDGHVLVGSSRERKGFDTTVDPDVTNLLLNAAVRLAPGIADLSRETAWAGLRPWLPGGLPAIGPTKAADGLFIATGHEGAGVAHGPITGRLIAQLICGERPDLDPKPFDPDRFSPG
jgi:D-hydroxyproline dehydrogenase subunit beta